MAFENRMLRITERRLEEILWPLGRLLFERRDQIREDIQNWGRNKRSAYRGLYHQTNNPGRDVIG
jgi:hypothetical protein